MLDDRGIEKVRGVSFEVRAGEIVGIAGIDGNGQTELIDAMTGLRDVDGGRGARRRGGRHDRDARTATSTPGSATSPRTGSGAASCSSSRSPRTSRSTTTAQPPDSRFGWLFPRRLVERASTADQGRSTSAAAARRRAAGGLSGGNQQKVVLAREIERDPKVLIAAQPTRGLDVGAIEFVHRRLIEERDEGRAILLVSLELEEILSLSDRILVIYEGEIVGEFPPTATEEELGIAMTGGGRARRGGGVSDRRSGRRPDQPSGGLPRAGREQSAGLRGAATRSRSGRRARSRRSSPSLLAFVIGGLVVLVTTGKNPLETYRAIFEGSGLNWFFPWVTGDERTSSPRSTCSRR